MASITRNNAETIVKAFELKQHVSVPINGIKGGSIRCCFDNEYPFVIIDIGISEIHIRYMLYVYINEEENTLTIHSKNQEYSARFNIRG